MSRRKKFATLDEGQQQITSFFVKVPRPVSASVQATQPSVQQQITSFFGRVPRPGAAGVQATPPTLSPSMPVSRSLDVSSPPSQLSSHQFLPTAHVNDDALSTMEKKGDDEEVVCGDQMDVNSCDDSFVKFVNPICAADFGSPTRQKSAQLSEDEEEEEEELSTVLRRPNSKDVQKFKVDYDHYTESDEEDDDTYPTEFNRGEMESFLAEQQSSSKCTDFMRPLAEDESVPIRRGPLSMKVHEFKERYDSDTKSDEEDDDTYPTEFYQGEMESFLAEQQSSSKCTDFMRPLAEDELMPINGPLSKKSQKFQRQPDCDSDSEEKSSSYTTAINQQLIEIIEIDDEDDEVAKPSAITYSSDNQETTLPNRTNYKKIQDILTGCKQLTPEITDFVFKYITLKQQLLLKLFVVNSADKFQCGIQDHRGTGIQFDLAFKLLRDHLNLSHNINVKSIVEFQYKNNNDKITRMLNEPLSQKTKDFVVQQLHHHNSPKSSILTNVPLILDIPVFKIHYNLEDIQKRLLNLFTPSSDVNGTLNCLLDHKKVNDGKNIKIGLKKEALSSKYFTNAIAHLEKAHKISVQMIKDQTTVTSGSKTFDLTKEPQKETVQVFLRERSRLQGDTVTPLFEYLTTETSNEFVLYELLSPKTFIALKFFTVDLQKKTFVCRLKHKQACTFKALLKKYGNILYCFGPIKDHIRHIHKITSSSLEKMVKEGCSPEIKTILEGPLLPDTQTLAISECHRLLKEYYEKEKQSKAERQTLIAKAIQSTSPYTSVQQNDPSFVRAIILQMFPTCLIDYLNDEEGFIREATQLEEEALSTIRNSLQNPDLNSEFYTFSLRPLSTDICSLLDVFIYSGQTNLFRFRRTSHSSSLEKVSNSKSVTSEKLYSFVANAINNNHPVYMNCVNGDISEKESQFIEHCAILFTINSSLCGNANAGYKQNATILSKDQLCKIGCYQIVKLLKTGKYDKDTNLVTMLPAKFNKSYKTGPVETAFSLTTNHPIPTDFSLVYGTDYVYESQNYAVHLFLSIFTFPPRMTYMYLHSQVDLTSDELQEAVAMVVTNHPKSFKDCFERARSYFHLIFIQNVQEANKVLEKVGASYFRNPSIEESDHAKSFIKATAILFARLYKIAIPSENEINSLLYNSTHPITVLFPSRSPVDRITKFVDLSQLLPPALNSSLPSTEELISNGLDINPIDFDREDQNIHNFCNNGLKLRTRNWQQDFTNLPNGLGINKMPNETMYFRYSHMFPQFYH